MHPRQSPVQLCLTPNATPAAEQLAAQSARHEVSRLRNQISDMEDLRSVRPVYALEALATVYLLMRHRAHAFAAPLPLLRL